jgi:predicted O-methyltransferase YrrM
MILFRVSKYLKYILLSRHRRGHGIHSPFVFDLVTRVFRNKIDKAIVFKVEEIRRKMLSDRSTIVVNDLGSRSKVSESNLRKVSDIARKSPVPARYGVLLARLASEFGSPLIIEFGTSVGISTMYMAAACKDSQVITIEGCENIAQIAKRNFISSDLKNITVITASFDEALSDLGTQGLIPGLVFIDGNHKKEPVLKYFNKMAESADGKTVIVIDDINYSSEMADAWKEIKKHKKVSVSVDIFRMGILFFREGINHNNYIIRY